MIGTALVLSPNAPLVPILVGTQVLNAVLLVPLLFAMIGLGRDRDLMGRFAIGRAGLVVYAGTTAVVVVCVVALGVTVLLG
jgi:Mn2+/Fe2+ NRAMP family transporter